MKAEAFWVYVYISDTPLEGGAVLLITTFIVLLTVVHFHTRR